MRFTYDISAYNPEMSRVSTKKNYIFISNVFSIHNKIRFTV